MSYTFIYSEDYGHLNEFSGEILDSNISIWTGILGIPDTSSLETVQLSLYLDGQLEQNTNILRGKFVDFKIDVTNQKIYSWKYQILQGRCDYVYILRWSLK